MDFSVASAGSQCRMAREHALLGNYEASIGYLEGVRVGRGAGVTPDPFPPHNQA